MFEFGIFAVLIFLRADGSQFRWSGAEACRESVALKRERFALDIFVHVSTRNSLRWTCWKNRQSSSKKEIERNLSSSSFRVASISFLNQDVVFGDLR